jgi:hypothetical protein
MFARNRISVIGMMLASKPTTTDQIQHHQTHTIMTLQHNYFQTLSPTQQLTALADIEMEKST